ncbi:hypothetical protein AAMO2058_001669800, partial [Amorphochlora amoebiformis]
MALRRLARLAGVFACAKGASYCEKGSQTNPDITPEPIKVTVIGAKWCGYSRKFYDGLSEGGWMERIRFIWIENEPNVRPPNEELPMPEGYPTAYLCDAKE